MKVLLSKIYSTYGFHINILSKKKISTTRAETFETTLKMCLIVSDSDLSSSDTVVSSDLFPLLVSKVQGPQ